jgi:hypothetical protein
MNDNEKIRSQLTAHRDQVLLVARQLRDIRDGRVEPDAVAAELDDLAAHLEQITRRIEETEKLVLR